MHDNFPDGSIAAVSQFSVAGEGALHEAAAQGASLQVLQALVDGGANVNGKDEQGETPLFAAAREDWPQTCRDLLTLGADALVRNAKGKTARALPGLSDEVQEALLEAEELSKRRRAEQQERLWGSKLQATQTASACRLGCL